jgi:hypothetical protein
MMIHPYELPGLKAMAMGVFFGWMLARVRYRPRKTGTLKNVRWPWMS